MFDSTQIATYPCLRVCVFGDRLSFDTLFPWSFAQQLEKTSFMWCGPWFKTSWWESWGSLEEEQSSCSSSHWYILTMCSDWWSDWTQWVFYICQQCRRREWSKWSSMASYYSVHFSFLNDAAVLALLYNMHLTKLQFSTHHHALWIAWTIIYIYICIYLQVLWLRIIITKQRYWHGWTGVDNIWTPCSQYSWKWGKKGALAYLHANIKRIAVIVKG